MQCVSFTEILVYVLSTHLLIYYSCIWHINLSTVVLFLDIIPNLIKYSPNTILLIVANPGLL